MAHRETDDLLTGILETTQTIALVGATAKAERPAHGVMRYLLERGLTVYPVNPGHAGGEILGQPVYGSLAEVPGPCDLVDIFRPSDAAGEIAREAARLAPEKGFQVVWMQQGIENAPAAAEAEAAGLVVVQNRCLKVEYRRLLG